VAPEQPQRHSLGTVHKIFQKSEYPLFLSFWYYSHHISYAGSL
jgi:hypothetical protein